MAHIRKDEELVFTKDEALAYITNLDGKPRFQVFVRADLPTSKDVVPQPTIFEGSTCISVSRKTAKQIITDMLRGLDARGAHVRLSVRAPSMGSQLSFVTIY